MPFSLSIDPAQGITRVWFDGAITGRDIIAATDELVAHPDYAAAFDQLWVLTGISSLDITPEEMSALVAHDAGLVEAGVMGHVRVGIAVAGEVRELAIRFYVHQMRESGQEVRVFETAAAAEAWLQEAPAQ